MAIYLPIRTESPNVTDTEHWAKRNKRNKAHKAACVLVQAVPLPCIVNLSRVSPRELDDDNLVRSFKSVRDGIADRLGLPNDRDPRVQWRYSQERGKPKEYAVKVWITPA